MMLSLNARVLLATSTVLASFFGLAGLTLDRAFQLNAETSLRERLQGQVYALISTADLDDNGRVYISAVIPEARFSMLGYHLYAQLTDQDGKLIWRTPSLESLDVNFITGLKRNSERFKDTTTEGGVIFTTYSIGIAWEDNPKGLNYTFSAAESREGIDKQIKGFQRNLWGWLGGVALLLLTVQGAIVSWGLSPLLKVAEELEAIKLGNQDRLRLNYPGELKGLTDNVNALLTNQKEHLSRYRHTLDDLAHSLKTPLAVLQSASDDSQSSSKLVSVVKDQVKRMNQITEHQLQRAAAAGQIALVAPLSIPFITDKVVSSLDKVYMDKRVQCTLDIDKDIVYRGDQGDLMEIIGNLADNAYKWCDKRVEINARLDHESNQSQVMCIIQVNDDGPGVSAEIINHVLRRGVRADQGLGGQGIGLSVVQDIVHIYGGSLQISTSPLGGAAFTVTLPELS